MMQTVVPRNRKALLAVAVVFIVMLLLRAPASLISLALPNTISLQNVEGSLWHGKASALGLNGALVQEQLRWDFLPQSLLHGSAKWQLGGQWASQNSRATGEIGLGGIKLSDLELIAPLEPIATLSEKLKPAQFGALLHLATKAIGPHQKTEATLNIEHLFTPLAPKGELGNYRADVLLEPNGQGNWQISTSSGDLQITGSGTFDLPRKANKGQIVFSSPNPIPGLAPLLSKLPKSGDQYVMSF